MSFAATMATEKVATQICTKDPGVFMHGPTFMGNPLACAAANASLDLIRSYDLTTMIGRIQDQLDRELAPARECPIVTAVRVLGAIGVVELKERVNMGLFLGAFV